MVVPSLHSADARPRLDLPRTGGEVVLDVLAIAGVVATIAVSALVWPALPDHVPTHFGFDGKPDGWGSKATFLTLPAVSVVLYLALSLLARFPHRFNYVRPISERNAATQYRLARRTIAVLKTFMAWQFAWLAWSSSEVAQGRATGLGPITPVLLGVLLAAIVWYFVRARRAT